MRVAAQLLLLFGIGTFVAACNGAGANPPPSGGAGGNSQSALIGDWQVQSVYGHPTTPRDGVRISFHRDGSMGGEGGCNSFSGRYQILSGGRFAAEDLLSTLMACEFPGFDTESAMFQMFENPVRYDIAPDGRLILTAIDGQQVIAGR